MRYFHNISTISICLILLTFCSCQEKVEPTTVINVSDISQDQKKRLITRLQDEVNKKVPFQGSRIHQYKCDSLIALGHNIVGALQEKSTPYTKIGDYHIAFPLLEEAAEIDPENALYYYSWLLLYYFRDYERALERLDQYDNFTPNQHDVAWGENVNYLKGLAYKQLGLFPQAIEEFTKAINDEGVNVDVYAYVYRGITFFNQGLFDLALNDFDSAIEEYNKCSMAYYWKAETLAKKGIYSESMEILDKTYGLLEKGYVKTDPYMEVFDVPSMELVLDRKIVIYKLLN